MAKKGRPGHRRYGRQSGREAEGPALSLVRGVELVDLIERVPGGWYEVVAVGGSVRMDARDGYDDTLCLTVNGHPLERDSGPDTPARQVFKDSPSQFTAVLLVAMGAPDLIPGRYQVTTQGIQPLPPNPFGL